MSPMRIIILLLALAAAGGAAFLVMQLSQPQIRTETISKDKVVIEELEVSKVEVLTVTRDIAIGETVKATDSEGRGWILGDPNAKITVNLIDDDDAPSAEAAQRAEDLEAGGEPPYRPEA